MTPIMKRTSTLALFTVAVATGVACSSGPADTPAAAESTPLAVRTVAIAEASVTDAVEAGGVVQARTAATLAARVMAPVQAVRVAPGDRVRAGQVLVELDGRDLTSTARSATAGAAQARDGAAAATAEQRAAHAGLDLAKATHGRIATLFARKSATAQEMDDAAAALAAAEARAASADARVQEAGAGVDRAAAASDAATAMAGFLRLTAPFDGVVTEKLVNVGDMATPGLPLVRLEDTRGYRLEVRLDESQAAHLAAGAALDVVLDGLAAPVSGRVAEVSRAIDAGSRSFLVKIDLPAGTAVRSGAFGRARLPGQARKALVVPADAIVRHGQVTSVFVADGGHARLRLVRLQGTEVLAGLAAGDQVIVTPPPALVDGRAINGGTK